MTLIGLPRPVWCLLVLLWKFSDVFGKQKILFCLNKDILCSLLNVTLKFWHWFSNTPRLQNTHRLPLPEFFVTRSACCFFWPCPCRVLSYFCFPVKTSRAIFLRYQILCYRFFAKEFLAIYSYAALSCSSCLVWRLRAARALLPTCLPELGAVEKKSHQRGKPIAEWIRTVALSEEWCRGKHTQVIEIRIYQDSSYIIIMGRGLVFISPIGGSSSRDVESNCHLSVGPKACKVNL